MKKLVIFGVFVVVLCLSTASTMADMTFGTTELQSNLDSITEGGVSSIDITQDYIDDDRDSYWEITASGGSFTTLVFEATGWANTNTFGVFDSANPNTFVQLFNGAQAPGEQATLSIKTGGHVWVNLVDTGIVFTGNAFGYYLDSSDSDNRSSGRFYSDTQYNSDQVDHMAAYQGNDLDVLGLPGLEPGVWTSNEYILAFEDTLNGGNFDYNDFVVMVESVHPVPVPGAILLGMLGMSAAGLRLRRFA